MKKTRKSASPKEAPSVDPDIQAMTDLAAKLLKVPRKELEAKLAAEKQKPETA